MRIQILQTTDFAKDIAYLIKRGKLKNEDFEDFKKDLINNPYRGDVISKTGGIRKIRLKSSSKGKKVALEFVIYILRII